MTTATPAPVCVTRSISRTRGVLTLFWMRPASACQAHGSAGRSLKSSPVNTATTPGCFLAFSVLICLILACAYGLRRIAACTIPVSFTSSRYLASPVIRRGSSLRLIAAPITFVEVDIASSFLCAHRFAHLFRFRFCGGHGFGGIFHRFDDVLIACAAAEGPFQPMSDLFIGWSWIVVQQVHNGDDHAGCAEPA